MGVSYMFDVQINVEEPLSQEIIDKVTFLLKNDQRANNEYYDIEICPNDSQFKIAGYKGVDESIIEVVKFILKKSGNHFTITAQEWAQTENSLYYDSRDDELT
jgi:hypothetical protein